MKTKVQILIVISVFVMVISACGTVSKTKPDCNSVRANVYLDSMEPLYQEYLDVTSSVNLNALAQNYVGLENDRKNMWIVVADIKNVTPITFYKNYHLYLIKASSYEAEALDQLLLKNNIPSADRKRSKEVIYINKAWNELERIKISCGFQ